MQKCLAVLGELDYFLSLKRGGDEGGVVVGKHFLGPPFPTGHVSWGNDFLPKQNSLQRVVLIKACLRSEDPPPFSGGSPEPRPPGMH